MDVFAWLGGKKLRSQHFRFPCSDTVHLTELCQRQHNGTHFQQHLGDKSHLCSEKLSKHTLHLIFTGGFNTAVALTRFIPIVQNFIFDESISQMAVIETVKYKASFNLSLPYCPRKTMWMSPADCYVRSRSTVPLLLVSSYEHRLLLFQRV